MNDEAFITAGLKHYAEAATTVEQFEHSLHDLIGEVLSKLPQHRGFRLEKEDRKVKLHRWSAHGVCWLWGDVKGTLPTGESSRFVLGLCWLKKRCLVAAGHEDCAPWAASELVPDAKTGVEKSPDSDHFVKEVTTASELEKALPVVLSALLEATVAQAPAKGTARGPK